MTEWDECCLELYLAEHVKLSLTSITLAWNAISFLVYFVVFLYSHMNFLQNMRVKPT